MNTSQIMDLALQLAGFSDIPGDSAVYKSCAEPKRILFGVDVGVAELTMAKSLGYDLVIAHHPPMLSALHGWEVYHDHVRLMTDNGVPREAAEEAVRDRVNMMQSRFASANHDHFPSVAKLLDIGFMNIHQPLDELGRRAMQDCVDGVLAKDQDASLGTMTTTLAELPEFAGAPTNVELLVGQKGVRAGKTVVAHGALTNGGYEVARAYFDNGTDTVIYIHVPAQTVTKLRKEGLGQLIVTGHIASDLLGINPFVQELRDLGLDVDVFSGVRDEYLD